MSKEKQEPTSFYINDLRIMGYLFVGEHKAKDALSLFTMSVKYYLGQGLVREELSSAVSAEMVQCSMVFARKDLCKFIEKLDI